MEPNNGPKIEYLPYEQLPELTEDKISEEKINEAITYLHETPKWISNYESIMYFRSLNKFKPSLVKIYLPKIMDLLSKLSVSIRSGIMKITLILLGEILKNYQIENKEDFPILNKLTYIVLHAIFNSKSFIRTEAKNILLNNVANCKQYENINYCIELIDLMKNDKPIISDSSYEVFEILINKINFAQIEKESWLNLFLKIDELHDKKREIYVKKVVKILIFIKEKIGNEKLIETLNGLNKAEKYEIYEQWIKTSIKKNTSDMSFKEFKKKQLEKGK